MIIVVFPQPVGPTIATRCPGFTWRLKSSISFLSYAKQYTKPFNEISGVITELLNALACAARIFELIEEKKEIPDASDAVTLYEADGRVDIEDVYFSYVPDKKLIEDFNLHVKPGQRVLKLCDDTRYLVERLGVLVGV